MVEFNGTLKAFKRYLGPFLRVLVQQMTKDTELPSELASIAVEMKHWKQRTYLDGPAST